MNKTDKTEETFPEKYDALKAAPNSHKVLLENENVRVVEVVIQPGQKEPMHHHKWPSVMIVDTSTDLKYFDSSGKQLNIKGNPSLRKTEWMEPEPIHAVENLDKETTYHAIRIELKMLKK